VVGRTVSLIGEAAGAGIALRLAATIAAWGGTGRKLGFGCGVAGALAKMGGVGVVPLAGVVTMVAPSLSLINSSEPSSLRRNMRTLLDFCSFDFVTVRAATNPLPSQIILIHYAALYQQKMECSRKKVTEQFVADR